MFQSQFARRVLRLATVALLLTAVLFIPTESSGQVKGGKGKLPDFIPAGYDDYQNMQDQLSIKKMRSGWKPADSDKGTEAKANPYTNTMPELMKFKDGTMVTKAEQWPKRRAEIVEDFEVNVYGRVPKNVPKVTWNVTNTVEGESGGIATVTKTLVGTVDNSGFPAIKVEIQASFTVPKYTNGKVPIILQFGGAPPAPGGGKGGAGGFGGGGKGGAIPWNQQALNKGWGYGTIYTSTIQADGPQLRQGIIGLTNKGQPRSPEDWGSLRAWGWGVSCLIDYFEANPDSGVDPTKVCITGVSRYGKAAVVATAFDTRVAAGFVASSGAGGVKLFRHIFGELLENVAARNEYHWMCGNYLKYSTEEGKFGKKTAADLPVDQHQLVALCAPRLCLISTGVKPGDPNWIDVKGAYMATVLAGPAYKLLGKKDLGIAPEKYLTEPLPKVNEFIGGELAWRQHSGGHDNTPNFPTFYEWAERYIPSPGLAKKK